MNLDDKTLASMTSGLAEFILSLPAKEQLVAWRTFLAYARLVGKPQR